MGTMNNIVTFNISSPSDIALQIAARVKARRLELDLTQEGLAARAGVKFATYRRFEQTGEISLRGLLQVGFALNTLSEFDALFAQKQYQSLDDVLWKFNMLLCWCIGRAAGEVKEFYMLQVDGKLYKYERL